MDRIVVDRSLDLGESRSNDPAIQEIRESLSLRLGISDPRRNSGFPRISEARNFSRHSRASSRAFITLGYRARSALCSAHAARRPSLR